MYTFDSVNNRTTTGTSVKTFPNFNAIEQMSKYSCKSNKAESTTESNTSNFDMNMFILMILLLSKNTESSDLSILPILLSLLI